MIVKVSPTLFYWIFIVVLQSRVQTCKDTGWLLLGYSECACISSLFGLMIPENSMDSYTSLLRVQSVLKKGL